MKKINAGRTIAVGLMALGLVAGASRAAWSAGPAGGMQIPGGVRGSDTKLTVHVKLSSRPVPVPAKVTIATPDGTVLMTGMTSSGTYVTKLAAGSYTVTATTKHYTATGTVTIADTASVLTLKLALKSPPVPTP